MLCGHDHQDSLIEVETNFDESGDCVNQKSLVSIKLHLYGSPLRQGPSELSKLWLIHQGGLSHDATEVGRENQSHHRP
jgi:hypothetical protein